MPPPPTPQRIQTTLHAPLALVDETWQRDVRISLDASGSISDITTDVAPAAGDERLAGPVIPGMPNAHSHAFQRAFAGYAERRGPGERDSFWTWRDTMYRFANRITPEQMAIIARWLYIEMLLAGYTAVAEFHYIHHAPGGTPYGDPAHLSLLVVDAAREAGIAITHLPVLYAQAGFGAREPLAEQARFINDAGQLLDIVARVERAFASDGNVQTGIAPHSLRAITPTHLNDVLAGRASPDTPIHIHIAEQTREVEECIAWCGTSPVRWLFDNINVDAHWCLVHATHMDAGESLTLAASGAAAGLCPTTEASLGDGLFPAPGYIDAGGSLAIGSDSNCAIDPFEELRLLEYGQRLRHRQRAIFTAPSQPSPGQWLYTAACRGGARALGINAGRLSAGMRADLVVLDPQATQIANTEPTALIDTLVFSPGAGAVRDVMVGGHWCVRGGYHTLAEQARSAFVEVRTALLRDT